jgi:hypothetical protein
MTPLLQFRLWWRRGSAAERLSVTIATGLVVALAAWILVPTTSDDSPTSAVRAGAQDGATAVGDTDGPSTQDTVAPGTDATGGTDGNGAAAGTGGTSGGTTGTGGGSTGTQSTGPSCLPTPPGAPGVTDDTITIAVTLLDLAGPIGNSAAGQQSADEAEAVAQSVINDINARGGVQCRELKAKFYKFNPINPDAGRASCLQVIEARPAVVADVGGFAFPQSAYLCIPQQKIPIITVSTILQSEVADHAPFLASPTSDATTMMRDTAFGLRDRGYFDPAKGFKKLGLLYDECSAEVNKALDDSLAKAGVTGASKFTFPCPPNGFGSPADMAQAVAQHRRDGVTHVIPLTGSGSFNRYADAAEAQRYRPKYAVTDYQGLPVTAASNLKPNGDNFDGAVAMTTNSFGMNTTPGAQIDAGTKRCQGLIVKAGVPAENVYKGAGGGCSALWDVEAALKGARSLAPDGILPGLFAAGPIQHAYSTPDATFKAPSKYYGGDTWLPIQWRKDCSCWHWLEMTRRPSFAP